MFLFLDGSLSLLWFLKYYAWSIEMASTPACSHLACLALHVQVFCRWIPEVTREVAPVPFPPSAGLRQVVGGTLQCHAAGPSQLLRLASWNLSHWHHQSTVGGCTLPAWRSEGKDSEPTSYDSQWQCGVRLLKIVPLSFSIIFLLVLVKELYHCPLICRGPTWNLFRGPRKEAGKFSPKRVSAELKYGQTYHSNMPHGRMEVLSHGN